MIRGRRVLADQGDDILHPMEDREDERDPHVVVALLELADQLLARGYCSTTQGVSRFAAMYSRE